LCEKSGGKIIVGDVWSGFDFEKINNIINKYLKISQDCLNCWLRRVCSLCYLSALKCLNSTCYLDKQEKKKSCIILRKNVLNDLKFYSQLISIDKTIFNGFTSNKVRNEK